MYSGYKRLQRLFRENNYDEVIDVYLDLYQGNWFTDMWEETDCAFYCALAYAYKRDYQKAIEMFEKYSKGCASIPRPSSAVQKCTPIFVVRLKQSYFESWYELWHELRYHIAPIEALIEDLWSPDLLDQPHTARLKIYEALKSYGEEAIPALLDALAINDRNSDLEAWEKDYPKIALLNIGDPAFHALVKAIRIDKPNKLTRAAIKLLRRFGIERAEPVLRTALTNPRLKSYRFWVEEELSIIENIRRRNSTISDTVSDQAKSI